MCQKFLKQKLKLSSEAKGVILEIKKEKGMLCAETILYDGKLREGDEIVIASFNEPIITKIRAMHEIEPLSFKFSQKKEITAATGLRLNLTTKEEVLSGMPFQKLDKNLREIIASFKKEISQTLKLEKEGIIIKADSLGSLEALLTLLKQAKISIVKAGIGDINKSDLTSAKANLEIAPLNAIILGFNVKKPKDIEAGGIKVLLDNVVYKLIENLEKWRTGKQAEIERTRLMSLSTICKVEILHQHVFRNSNPAVFGIHIHTGKIKKGLKLINEQGEEIARVKTMQLEKDSVDEASEGDELAIALPGINFERKLKETKFLYSEITESQFKQFKKNKDLLSANEIKTLHEIQAIKKKKKDDWGG